MRVQLFASGCVILGAALAGCRGDDPVRPLDVCQPLGVAISVGEGNSPEITWTPECRASDITVTRLDASGAAETVVWSYRGDGISSFTRDALPPSEPNRLTSPVRFGELPATSSLSSMPPLTSGHSYTVVLRARSGATSAFYTVASHTFER